MPVLENFPMVSQRTSITSDGRPSENAEQDCVEASVGAAILWYQGKKQWDKDINPDLLLGSAYPEGYQGGTAAIKLVPICQKLGFKLHSYDGIPGQLIAEAHRQLSLKHPVIFTEPDPYVSQDKGWSHVCVFYADAPGFLTAMDPYPLPGTSTGHAVYKSDAEWMNRLLFNQIWILERMEEDVITIDIHNPQVARYFKPLNDHQWQCLVPYEPNKYAVLQYGILSFYCRYGNAGLCGLTYLGLPKSNEINIEKLNPAFQKWAGHKIVVQYFERGMVIYDPEKLVDNPPGAGDVYLLHLYNGGPGQDPYISQLEAKIAALQKTSVDPALLAAIEKVKADVAALP